MKTACCCIRERLTTTLSRLVSEIDETRIEDFGKLDHCMRRLAILKKARELLKEAKAMKAQEDKA